MIGINNEDLASYYSTNFALMQHHNWSLTEIENMIDWEREIYVALLVNFLKEEQQEMERRKNA